MFHEAPVHPCFCFKSVLHSPPPSFNVCYTSTVRVEEHKNTLKVLSFPGYVKQNSHRSVMTLAPHITVFINNSLSKDLTVMKQDLEG
jgi:hypothetical protein